MIGRLAILLEAFRGAFPREATFVWFVIAILGFIVRLEDYGVSSIIRWLRIRADFYETFLAFFRSSAFKLEKILQHWQLQVAKRHAVRTSCGKRILVGDGIKVAKEANYMPGVKKLHQDSENSGKAKWIWGHHFGVVGTLVGTVAKIFCVPLRAEIHEGTTALRELQEKQTPQVKGGPKTTITTLMANLLVDRAKLFNEPCVGVLDAFFAVAPVFEIAKAAMLENGRSLLQIITRAKDNAVAYELDPPAYSGKGRPPKYGKRLKLKKLFDSHADKFESITTEIYGEAKTVSILCLDLWWKPLQDTLRFVLVQDGEQRFILMCSDLTMPPAEIVSLYAKRFKIEVTFKMVKHVLGGFSYHFWTKAWKFLGNNQCLQPEDIKNMPPKIKQLITNAINAVEGFVNLAMIATGLLQILAIEQAKEIQRLHRWWMRTNANEVPSEEMVKRIIQHEFFHNFRKFKHTAIYKLIQQKRRESKAEPSKMAA